ncbi:membrane protein insertion efficiency factor YidD [Trueperella bialowiezensis]|uniref:Putative membrane protein insertion efficiency factor n=1 Tax=Trueperella bialowiezensis TaxID=312285 RepID=A0A3S4VTG7_9ACTO|nr:membrane protein insertion efficiency factor YidD [Trueperella bialowiezensis]VEI13345.1 Putative membrane protein insertion efficiency factor [Trueperella bialowiezensis]
MSNPAVTILTRAIRWYQTNISAHMERRCRYQPTCSAYGLESIQIHGAIKGTLLTVWRLLRCNPWSKGGVDWVPPKGSWPKKPLGYRELIAYREKENTDHQASRGHGDDPDAP